MFIVKWGGRENEFCYIFFVRKRMSIGNKFNGYEIIFYFKFVYFDLINKEVLWLKGKWNEFWLECFFGYLKLSDGWIFN